MSGPWVPACRVVTAAGTKPADGTPLAARLRPDFLPILLPNHQLQARLSDAVAGQRFCHRQGHLASSYQARLRAKMWSRFPS